ncbi:hypothetical protein [Methylorubrum extorquens]|uniref:Uncharacterized protein n=1 Tax=Methylorubrum extorquens DSM 13060 TaxID=882800 RepID=H1KKP2_METEX|nr:hypothetical protein [Methylorubrum extorquens]EHP91893.1 hypothetical protein MetexDRAFT_3204 [Methylorubrum extorquens DSM 13060]
MGEERQELLDAFYHQHGPCCAGCDWWHSLNSRAGECRRTAMIPGADRPAPLGIVGASLALGAGHAMTPREHVCGEFKDGFDWRGLPPAYLRRIGAPTALIAQAQEGPRHGE